MKRTIASDATTLIATRLGLRSGGHCAYSASWHRLRVVRTRRAAIVLVVLVVAIVGSSANGAHPGRNGVIAFISERNGQEGALYTINADGSSLQRLTSPPALPASDVAFSRDGRLMAFSRPRRVLELWLARADGSAPRLLVRGKTEALAPTFSPDGRTVAYMLYEGETRSYDLWTVSVDSRHRRPLLAGPGMQAFPAWSPDGRRIAYGGDRGVYVLKLSTGKYRLVGPGGDPSWSPDGRRIASAGRYGVYVMRSTGGPPQKIAEQTRELQLEAPAWSPDGRRLALVGCCEEGTGPDGPFSVVVTMRPDGSDVRRTLGPFEACCPVWTRDGRLVFSDGVHLMAIRHLGGKIERYFPQSVGFVSSPAWSPNGRSLALGTLEGVGILDGRGKRQRMLGEGDAPAWSPDGERIAVEADDGIDVITVATRERDSVLPDEGASDSSKGAPSWSPSGDTIAYADWFGGDYGQLGFYDVPTRASQLTTLKVFGAIDWHPDGNALAYTGAGRCGDQDCLGIRLYDVRTRRSRLLIENGTWPVWSPDGRWLVFVRRLDGNQKLFLARADGSGVRQLTDGPSDDSEPAWQPLPR
jgi:Tol biopolymer transport system component